MTFCLSAAPAARAEDACVAPPMPAAVDGAAVSEDQMRAAAGAARAFIAQSDMYQDCLASQLDAARTEANADGKPLDPGLESAIKAKVAASQKAKEQVGASINAAIGLYKQTRAH
jgi:hypothetical protein